MKDTILNFISVAISAVLIFSAGSTARYFFEVNHLFSWIIGSLVIVFFTFFAGLSGLLYPQLFLFLWSGVLVFALFSLRRNFKNPFIASTSFLKSLSILEKAIMSLIVLRILFIFFGGTMQWPFGGSEADVLHYHLVLPRLYLEQHSLAGISWSIPDKYPLFMHMLYLAGFAVIGPLFVKTLVFLSYVGSQILIFHIALRYSSRLWCLVAVALFGGVPAIVIQAGTGMIDMLTLFFLLASFEAILRFNETGARNDLLLSGLAAGIVAASRAFTVAYAFLLLMVMLLAVWQKVKSWRLLLKDAGLFCLCVGVIYLPWVVRAFVLTGNPIFPLGYRFLGGDGLDASRVQGLEQVATAYGLGKGVLSFLQLPWNITFNFIAFDYPVGPIFLAFLPLIILFSPWRRMFLPFVTFAVFTLLWFAGSQQTRYLYFSLALFFIFLAAALSAIEQRSKWGIFFCMVLFTANIVLSCVQAQRQYARGWSRFLSGETNVAYLSRYVRNADTLEMVREKTPENARVLLVDGWPENLFYFPRYFVQGGSGVLTTTYWDVQAQSANDFSLKLKTHGITHILADKSVASLGDYAGYGLAVAENDRYILLEIKEA